jgi:hypothetical protein
MWGTAPGDSRTETADVTAGLRPDKAALSALDARPSCCGTVHFGAKSGLRYSPLMAMHVQRD